MLRSPSPPSRRRVPSARSRSPAIWRSKLDLPEPFGPVSTSAVPAVTLKERPSKTRRPPRRQVRSRAMRRRSDVVKAPAPALAGRKTRRPFQRFAGCEHLAPMLELIGKRAVIRQIPLLIGRHAIMSEARLRETRNFLCKLFRLFATFAFRHDAICKADLQSFCRINRAACEDQIHRARMADETRQTYRAAINKRHAPAATKNTHYRIFFHHTHVAPEREFKPACNSMTRNGGNHRFVENH